MRIKTDSTSARPGAASCFYRQFKTFRGGMLALAVGAFAFMASSTTVPEGAAAASVAEMNGIIDVDGDGIPDAIDNCLNTPNTPQRTARQPDEDAGNANPRGFPLLA